MHEAMQRCQAPQQKRKQDRSKRREEEILRAALRVFARDGISRSRIGDIAGQAGMPVSTIYEYYDSKEELAYQVPLGKLGAFFGEYAEAIVGKKTARERLRLYLCLAADFARRNPEWARVLYLELWPSVLVAETTLRQNFDDYVRIIIHLIRQGEQDGEWGSNNPYETAAILNGSVNQMIITSLLYRRPRNLTAAAAALVDRTMTLLGPAEGARRAKPRKARRVGASLSRTSVGTSRPRYD
ncbi:MAG TPA: TetR/AcrR family transcriptional regulator [Steroidobacteraceae bacterium]|nr:TetR/AcrR family transcriptional regulator [Steroidobacteraceae bacterium]